MSTFVLCVGCGERLYGFSPCRWCTREWCGIDLLNGICLLCNLSDSCAYDHNLNSFDYPPDSYHPSHPIYETYSGDTCGNDSHFGYDCPPRFPLNYEPEPGYIQNYNSYPHDSLSLPQQYPCCKDDGLEEEQAAKAQNWKLPVCYNDDDDEDSSYSLEDNIISELPPCVAITPTELVDSLNMGDEHLDTISATESDEFIKSSVENLVPNPSESEGENECDVPAGFTTFSNVLFDAEYDFDSSDDQSFSDEDLSEKIYSNPLFYEEIIPMKIDPHSFNIDSLFDEFASELTLLKSIPPGIDETDCHPEEETHFTKRLLYDNSSPRPPKEFLIQKKQEEKQIQEDQAANTRYWKIPAYYDDDDDEEESNSLKDNNISELPPCSAITPNETIDSLIMGDKHLDIVPATESDEFIKSSVENLVPNPSESEGENGCDVPSCFTTFSNILFDTEYEFNSVDNQPLHNEDFLEEIFSNPLFEEEISSIKKNQHHFNAESDLIGSLLNRDSSIISSSSKIDSLLDEFAGELTLLKSMPPGVDKTDCQPKNEIRLSQRLLYDNSSPRPPKEFVSKNSNADDESFSPFPIMEEIDLTFFNKNIIPFLFSSSKLVPSFDSVLQFSPRWGNDPGPGGLPVPDLRIIEELCQPSLNGRGGPIAPISIQATNFGRKNDVIQQVQNSCQFHGLPGDDANKHLDKFLHVTQSIKVNGVTDDTLRLCLFPHSLTHHATTWFDRVKPT
nr:reverse transcriptase domain-containing protein [Tanacetum cinerariifolium]